MAVYHVLKDGTVKTDLTGHTVKIEDVESLYHFLHKVNARKNPGADNVHNRSMSYV